MDKIEQKINKDSSNNQQIGIQNNYYIGLSAEDVQKKVEKVFSDNFPRLQEEAMKVVDRRAQELFDEMVIKLKRQGVKDYSAFKTPDMQYVFYEAQKNYARFGGEELKKLLISILAKRVKHDDDFYYRLLLDKAIAIADSLSEEQLDTLSLLFIIKRVHFEMIKDSSSLKTFFQQISVLKPCHDYGYSLLNTLGCLDLFINDSVTSLAKTYNLPDDSVSQICPQWIKDLHPDYAPSQLGIVLAIINLENKIPSYKFDYSIWIKR